MTPLHMAFVAVQTLVRNQTLKAPLDYYKVTLLAKTGELNPYVRALGSLGRCELQRTRPENLQWSTVHTE